MKRGLRKPVAFSGARRKLYSKSRQRPRTESGSAPMRLTPEQIKAFDEQGYVFFPNCFSEEEIALLRPEADNILKLDRPEVWREKSGAPRTAFAAHKFNPVFEVMSRHPRLVE